MYFSSLNSSWMVWHKTLVKLSCKGDLQSLDNFPSWNQTFPENWECWQSNWIYFSFSLGKWPFKLSFIKNYLFSTFLSSNSNKRNFWSWEKYIEVSKKVWERNRIFCDVTIDYLQFITRFQFVLVEFTPGVNPIIQFWSLKSLNLS